MLNADFTKWAKPKMKMADQMDASIAEVMARKAAQKGVQEEAEKFSEEKRHRRTAKPKEEPASQAPPEEVEAAVAVLTSKQMGLKVGQAKKRVAKAVAAGARTADEIVAKALSFQD